jgi:hypothetical protein
VVGALGLEPRTRCLRVSSKPNQNRYSAAT